MWSPLFHRVAAAAAVGSHRRFRRALLHPERAQRQVLSRILGELGGLERIRRAGLDAHAPYEDFAAALPVTDYAAIEGLVAEQRLHPGRALLAPGEVRFVPTSGSTAARKWIPATRSSGREFDAAAGAWMVDLARRHPSIRDGRHYWSLSWLPDELREQGFGNDDLALLPPFRRWVLRQTMAVPGSVAGLATSAASRRATAVQLAACRDLRLISVWSPTFFLALIEELDDARDAVVAILEGGEWEAGWDRTLGPIPGEAAPRSGRASRILRQTPSPLSPEALHALWPELAVVSAWDGATSAGFAAHLRERLPAATFQGKGLWATEGVVSIPFDGDYPVAVTSHFLEFRCLDTGRIDPVWRLRPGQRVQPLLTTGAGLLRHALDDRLLVTGRLARTPCLRFLGRLGGQDLVGEKMTVELAQAALADLDRILPLRSLCLCAVTPGSGPPRYVLLAEPTRDTGETSRAAELVELRLRRIHHYALARDARQLAPAGAVVRTDARALYARLRGKDARVEGGEKLEAVVGLTDPRVAEVLTGPDPERAVAGGEPQCASS